METFGALILAGGKGSRMGGVHKPGVRIGGVPLLDRVLAATAGAAPRVVVGPAQPVAPDVRLVREDPPGGGPVAALAAGLQFIDAVERVAVLAADLPFLTREALAALSGFAADGAVLVDAEGRDQYLAGVYRVSALRAAVVGVGDPSGVALRKVVGGLRLERVTLTAGPGAAPPWFDCDDADDVRLAETLARHEEEPA
jgi:molybdopterin-guanine dinucleotide biosynthesis protein A